MRVIGGEFRGRRLTGAVAPGIRPTSDRVREAMFDILFSLGGVDGLLVADLFAGTGAMGIEALSRGAASVTFVDQSPRPWPRCGPTWPRWGWADAERDGDATVVRADVGSWVATTASRYDLVLWTRPTTTRGGTPWWPSSGRSGRPGIRHRDRRPVRAGASSKPSRYGGTIVTVARPELVTEKGVS